MRRNNLEYSTLTAKEAVVQIINNINKSKIWKMNLDDGFREEKYFFLFSISILTIKKRWT